MRAIQRMGHMGWTPHGVHTKIKHITSPVMKYSQVMSEEVAYFGLSFSSWKVC
jgi:hypothetical protein